MPTDTRSTGSFRPYRFEPLDRKEERSLREETPATSVALPRERPAFGSEVDRPSPDPSPRRFQWTELEEAPSPPNPTRSETDRKAGVEEEEPRGPTPEELGRSMVDQARAEGAEIVALALAEAEGIREKARREGFEEGETEGRKRVELAAEGLEVLASELAGYKSALYQEARKQLTELALAVAEKILGPLAEADRGGVVRVAERAVQLLSERESLTIRVHPDDLKTLLEAKPKILEAFDGIQKLTVARDPNVKPGGCIVQTATTEIDARLDTQLQEIVRAMRNA